MEDLPALRSALHDQGKRTTRGGAVAPLKNESGGYQCQGRTERPNLQLLEVETVPPGTGGKPGSIVVANEVEPVPCSVAIHVGGRALGGIVRHECVQVTPVPVTGGPVQLSRQLAGKRGTINRRRRRRLSGGPTCHQQQRQKEQGGTHGDRGKGASRWMTRIGDARSGSPDLYLGDD